MRRRKAQPSVTATLLEETQTHAQQEITTAIPDTFGTLLSEGCLKQSPDVTFDQTRKLIQEAEISTGSDFFDLLEIFSVEITPEIAQKLLDCNIDNNRPISSAYVSSYAKKMREGQWGFSSPLIFSSHGALIDGQHRLNAVIKAKIAQKFIVIVGLPDETAGNIDRGRRRTAIDVSTMAGLSWVKGKHTSTAKFMTATLDAEKNYKVKESFETEDLLPFLEKYHEGIIFAVDVVGLHGDNSLGTIMSVIAKAYYSHPDMRQRLWEFGTCLKKNTTQQGVSDNAALLLGKKIRDLKEARTARGGANWSPYLHSEVIKYTQAALFHFLKNTNPERLKTTKKRTVSVG
jgi:hypothetical protein